MPGLLGVPVPANLVSGATGSMARLHTMDPFMGASSSRHLAPPSSLSYRPMSVPAYTTSGRRGSESSARTIQSECNPCRTLARVQVAPSSALIMTPWPTVPTRMVPLFAMAHLLERARCPDYTPMPGRPGAVAVTERKTGRVSGTKRLAEVGHVRRPDHRL